MDTDTAATIGQLVRDRRRDRGMTQVRLAAAAALSQATISLIESDRLHPSHASLVRLGSALGLTDDEAARWIQKGTA